MQKDDDFLKSPAEAPVHRKVLLEDKDISPKTQKSFDKLCEKYDDIISKNSGDIGKTMLIEMEIDTGNHPPIASKPYTLPLKHSDWVQKEIETLERAGIIERSISPWASPVVIVPKKSAPGELPRRRMCVDYQKINKLQPKVTKADSGKGSGKTMLIEMEIDTGNHPPIASKPYTLPLKHSDWVQKEIETLERAGIIERSISPWASPVVIVPKKSAPGELPRRRMCVDYQKINKLQPKVTKADSGKGSGKTMLIEMEIDTGNHPPIASKPYTLPLKHSDWVQKEIETLERAGIIERSISPWASPVVIVPKKSAPGELPRRRMCVDYQKINKLQPKVTKADSGKGCISLIPLSKIDELYAKLKGYKVFSSLDLRSGYYHIALKDSAKPKSAFVLSSLGKYQFNKVPFGLAQAPAYFQKLINGVLKGCNFAMGYLDNIIIYSRSEKEHLEHLEEIFTRLKTAGLKLNLEKCCFFKKHIQYLGHLISADGIQPLPEKLESIAKMPAPKNPKEVKQFLGVVGYYRKFVPRFADISRVLTHLTKKDIEFKWTPECENCFQFLKEFLQQAPILRYPDPQASYTLYTDASKYA